MEPNLFRGMATALARCRGGRVMEIRPETLGELDFDDDEPTVIRVRDDELAPKPELITAADLPDLAAADLPALPFELHREKSSADEEAWLDALDPSARIILERAMVVAPRWPIAPRIRGAVAVPTTHRIPSLSERV